MWGVHTYDWMVCVCVCSCMDVHVCNCMQVVNVLTCYYVVSV